MFLKIKIKKIGKMVMFKAMRAFFWVWKNEQ